MQTLENQMLDQARAYENTISLNNEQNEELRSTIDDLRNELDEANV